MKRAEEARKAAEESVWVFSRLHHTQNPISLLQWPWKWKEHPSYAAEAFVNVRVTAGGSDKSPGGMSSTTLKEDDVVRCCASCGIAEVDNIRLLQDCTACNLVRFCSIECQREHSLQHKHDCCSTKRVLTTAESRDEILFKQPERTHDGDCPICLIPLSIDLNKSTMMACCSKVICIGCDYAIQIREVEDRLDSICPFCREHIPTSQEEADRNRMKRIEVNDPVAIRQMGARYCSEGDYKSAFQYYTKAAELGDVGAHYELSLMYRDGKVVEKDKEKELYLLEQAAIRGHPFARHNLGCAEWKNDRHDRAMKHFIIAAKLGHDNSLGALKLGFQRGLVSKEDFAAALRAHQAAVDATKSAHREAVEAALQMSKAAKELAKR